MGPPLSGSWTVKLDSGHPAAQQPLYSRMQQNRFPKQTVPEPRKKKLHIFRRPIIICIRCVFAGYRQAQRQWPLQPRHTSTASFTCRHYKENDHGQRTTAQDQGSEETQEATGARQVTGTIRAFDVGWVRRGFLRRNPTNQIITPIGDIENQICWVTRSSR